MTASSKLGDVKMEREITGLYILQISKISCVVTFVKDGDQDVGAGRRSVS
jgi:predicted secreted protein